MTSAPRRLRRSGKGIERQRVFVALWPTTEVRARLATIVESIAIDERRAHRMRPANLHCTLAFIGSLEVDTVAHLGRRLGECAVAPLDWVLDRLGHFDGARVLWAGGPANAALDALATRVRDLLDTMAVDYDRKPFVPHVTLIRGIGRWTAGETRIEPPVVWRCTDATLVVSEQGRDGVNYMPLLAR